MEISINGKKTDITLDTEKTLGEVLAGLENWLAASGEFRLSGITLDGQTISAETIPSIFNRTIDDIQKLDAAVTGIEELLVEALLETRRAIENFENIDYGERKNYGEKWKTGAAAVLLAEQRLELYTFAEKTFSGVGLAPKDLLALIDEHLRELENPEGELKRIEPIIADVAGRMEELPLDIQTGKDQKAAQTIQYFSTIAEKIFRLYKILETAHLSVNEKTVVRESGEEVSVSEYISEFLSLLKEMLAAYETRDAVLVGDLAEYELAPRLRILYMGMIKCVTDAAVSPIVGDA